MTYSTPLQECDFAGCLGGKGYVDLTTSGVIGGINSGSFGGPGVGLAYRITKIAIVSRTDNAGSITVFNNVAGEMPYCLNVSPTRTADELIIPEPGYQQIENFGLNFSSISNAASQHYSLFVYFIVDRIA